jgi:hypothetical protein
MGQRDWVIAVVREEGDRVRFEQGLCGDEGEKDQRRGELAALPENDGRGAPEADHQSRRSSIDLDAGEKYGEAHERRGEKEKEREAGRLAPSEQKKGREHRDEVQREMLRPPVDQVSGPEAPGLSGQGRAGEREVDHRRRLHAAAKPSAARSATASTGLSAPPPPPPPP